MKFGLSVSKEAAFYLLYDSLRHLTPNSDLLNENDNALIKSVIASLLTVFAGYRLDNTNSPNYIDPWYRIFIHYAIDGKRNQ